MSGVTFLAAAAAAANADTPSPIKGLTVNDAVPYQAIKWDDHSVQRRTVIIEHVCDESAYAQVKAMEEGQKPATCRVVRIGMCRQEATKAGSRKTSPMVRVYELLHGRDNEGALAWFHETLVTYPAAPPPSPWHFQRLSMAALMMKSPDQAAVAAAATRTTAQQLESTPMSPQPPEAKRPRVGQPQLGTPMPPPAHARLSSPQIGFQQLSMVQEPSHCNAPAIQQFAVEPDIASPKPAISSPIARPTSVASTGPSEPEPKQEFSVASMSVSAAGLYAAARVGQAVAKAAAGGSDIMGSPLLVLDLAELFPGGAHRDILRGFSEMAFGVAGDPRRCASTLLRELMRRCTDTQAQAMLRLGLAHGNLCVAWRLFRGYTSNIVGSPHPSDPNQNVAAGEAAALVGAMADIAMAARDAEKRLSSGFASRVASLACEWRARLLTPSSMFNDVLGDGRFLEEAFPSVADIV